MWKLCLNQRARNTLLKIIALLLTASAAAAQTQPPMNVEQRLAVQVANMSLQAAQMASKIDELNAELEKLKAQCHETPKK